MKSFNCGQRSKFGVWFKICAYGNVQLIVIFIDYFETRSENIYTCFL